MILYRVTIHPEDKVDVDTIEELKKGVGFFKVESPPKRIDTEEGGVDTSDWPESEVYSSLMDDGSVVYLFKDEKAAYFFTEGMKVASRIILGNLGVGTVDANTGERL